MKKLLVLLLLVSACGPAKFSDHRESVYYVKIPGRGGGTGWATTTAMGRTVIVTNDHICRGSTDGFLELSQDGFDISQRAEIIYESPLYDLCLVKAPSDAIPLVLAEKVKLWQHMHIVGHPHLRPIKVTEGEITDRAMVEVGEQNDVCPVSPNFRKIESLFGNFCVGTFNAYLSSAESQPGNSGSPVLDDRGQVIGVLFAGGNSASIIITLDSVKVVLGMF